jgi:hypothetical protein
MPPNLEIVLNAWTLVMYKWHVGRRPGHEMKTGHYVYTWVHLASIASRLHHQGGSAELLHPSLHLLDVRKVTLRATSLVARTRKNFFEASYATKKTAADGPIRSIRGPSPL